MLIFPLHIKWFVYGNYIISLQIEHRSERRTYYTKCYRSRDYTFGNRVYYVVQYCMTCLVLQVHLLQYILRGQRKTEQEMNVMEHGQSLTTSTASYKLRFLFQASTEFSQSTICIVFFYQVKKSVVSI